LLALSVAINSSKLLSQIYNGAIGLSYYGIPNTFVAKEMRAFEEDFDNQ
jgi:hypothetical protein